MLSQANQNDGTAPNNSATVTVCLNHSNIEIKISFLFILGFIYRRNSIKYKSQ